MIRKMNTKNEPMRSLYDYFQEQIDKLIDKKKIGNNTCCEKILESDEKAKSFIQSITFSKVKIFDKHDEDLLLNENYKNRAIHSVCVFLLGLTIGEFCDLFNECEKVLSDEEIQCFEPDRSILKYRLWILMSVLHDYGYFSKNIMNENLDIRSYLPYVLSDDCYYDCKLVRNYSMYHGRVLKLSYKEIERYNDYARKYHECKNDKFEKNDHGIIGGVEAFEKQAKSYIERFLNNEIPCRVYKKNILYYKTACLTVCQHNIYKSKKESDEKYKQYELDSLLSSSGYSVGIDTPLLALLSLVDTIECIKSVYKTKKNIKKFSVIDILKIIKICVRNDCIILDYTALFHKMESSEMNNTKKLENLCTNIKSLPDWTDFNVVQNDNVKYCFSITLKTKP